MDIKRFLFENQDILKITAIEKNLNMPDGTIRRMLAGTRDLPQKWEKPIEEYLREKFKPLYL